MAVLLRNSTIRKAAFGAIPLLLILLFFGHFWLLNKINLQRWAVNGQASELKEKILTDAGITSDKRYTTDTEKIIPQLIAQSPRAQEYASLKIKEQKLSDLEDYLVGAIGLWPFSIIALATLAWLHYWKGEGLDHIALVQRRDKMRTITGIALVGLATLLVVFWRFTAARANWRITIVLAAVVAGFLVMFVQLVWKLMLSAPRTGSRFKVISPTYRFAIQAGVVALIAFATLSDVTTRNLFGSIFDPDPLAVLGLQSMAWLAAVISLGSIMMGYLRLPALDPKKSGETTRNVFDREPEEISVGSSFTKLADQSSELSKLSDNVAMLISLVQSPDHSKGSLRDITKHQPLKSDEVVRERSEQTRQRLLTEVQSLTKRGNLNLIIGSVTSLIAATILWMLVARAPTGTLGSAALVGYYIPRISVAVFIEVFSFFFLRLYRNGLSEIMYYQNELTSLESRTLALEIAALMPPGDTIPQLLQNLSKTDRNFVLKTGESTVELEKIKVDQENIHALFDSLLSKVGDLKNSITK